MVDVRPGSWQAPVVKHPYVGQTIQHHSQTLLPSRSLGPSCSRIGLGGFGQDQAAQNRMSTPYLRFASGTAALVFLPRRGTWTTRGDLRHGKWVRGLTIRTGKAGNCLLLRIPAGFHTCRQACLTLQTHPRVSKSDDPGVHDAGIGHRRTALTPSLSAAGISRVALFFEYPSDTIAAAAIATTRTSISAH